MGLLRIYVDDSADQTQQKLVLAGAFVGWWHQWSKLRQKWRKCLKKHQITFFHSTECRSLQGEFFRFRNPVNYPIPKGREAADQIRNELDAIIHQSGVMGIAACVPVKDYQEIRKNEPHANVIFPEDEFEMALQAMFKICAETVINDMGDTGHHRVAFICDHSSSALKIEKMFAEFRTKNPGYADVLESLVHQDDKQQPQLQAADLMAHLAKDRFSDWLDDPAIFTNKPELKKRLKQLSVYQIAVCNKDWLLDALAIERKTRGLV